MENQKGSVKDRLRAMFLFLEYKKMKRKKEKEIKKKKKKEQKTRIKAEQIRLYGKYYSKPKVACLTILGLLGSLFIPRSSKKKVQHALETIQEEQNKIFLKLEQDHDVEEIYQEIDNTYQKLENLKKKYKKQLIVDSFNPVKSKQVLKTIDNKQKELEIINDICHKKEKEKEKKVNAQGSTLDIQKQKSEFIQKKGIDAVHNDQNNVSENDKAEVQLLPKIKQMNVDLKEYEKEMLFLKEKIEQEELYSTLFEYEFRLKQIKIRLNKMLEEYEKLKEDFSLEVLNEVVDIEVIDKYELHKDDKAILQKVQECEILLKNIEEKKELLTNKKQQVEYKNNTKKGIENEKSSFGKNKQDEVKEEEKKQLKEQFDDTFLATKIILNNILEEKKMVEKIRRKVYHQNPMVRKRSLFFYAKRFTTSFVSFGFSLLPIRYFRNRLLGMLVSGIMINNSLRTTRRILGYDTSYILYNDVLKEIDSNQDSVSKLYDVCLDSQEQIRKIKEHLDINFSMMRDYDNELMDFYKQLDDLNNQLEVQIRSLKDLNEEYSDIKDKVKVRKYSDKY